MEKIRLQYIDLLKFLSIFAIISLHTFKVWKASQILNIDIYGFSQFWSFGVPVFLMISGALLLNRNIELKSFFKKKVKRLVYPFIFFYFLTVLFGLVMNITHSQITNVLSFRWYFWMILGVYISIPIINKFIQHSSIKEIEYFISVFIIASIFYQITYYFRIEQYFYLTLFLSPLGYLILGYYLSIKKFDISNNKIILISILLFLTSTFVKSCSIWGYIPNIDDFVVNQSVILYSWLDVGFFEIIQSSSLFLMIKYIYELKNGIFLYLKQFLESKIISKFITSVSKASYGMYLINLIPTLLYYKYLQPMILSGTQIVITIFIVAVSTFILTWLIILIFSKLPIIKNFSGYA